MKTQTQTISERLMAIEAILITASDLKLYKFNIIGLLQDLEIIKLLLAHSPENAFLASRFSIILENRPSKHGDAEYVVNMHRIAYLVCVASIYNSSTVLSGKQTTYPVKVAVTTIKLYIRELTSKIEELESLKQE